MQSSPTPPFPLHSFFRPSHIDQMALFRNASLLYSLYMVLAIVNDLFYVQLVSYIVENNLKLAFTILCRSPCCNTIISADKTAVSVHPSMYLR